MILAEARDADGEPRLLQLVHLRAPRDDGERPERQREERQLAQRTAQLIGDAEIVVHAHGGADLEGGERAIFWALPWSEPELLPSRAPLSSKALTELGLALAQRLVVRHAEGEQDPLLSEQVLCGRAGGPRVLTLPLAPAARWLAPTVPALRLAPEERADEVPQPSGDLWRLGALLEHLGRGETLGPELETVLERLSAEAPERLGAVSVVSLFSDHLKSYAPSRSEAVTQPTRVGGRGSGASGVGQIRALPEPEPFGPEEPTLAGVPSGEGRPSQEDPLAVTSWELPLDTGKTEVTREEPVLVQAAPLPEPSVVEPPLDFASASERALSVLSEGSGPRVLDLGLIEPEVRAERSEVGAGARGRVGSALPGPGPADPEAVTREAEPLTPLPAMPRVSELSEGAQASGVSDELLAAPPEITLADTPRALEAVTAPTPVVTVATTEELSARPPAPRASDTLVDEPAGEGESNGHDRVALEALAAAWDQPLLPSGESPWSEVLAPRGAHHRARADFPGITADLPIPALPAELKAPVAAAKAHVAPDDGEIEEELAAAISGFDPRKVVIGVLAVLVIFGVFALLGRTGNREAAVEVAVAPPSNELLLESEPAGATVIAEADGKILGKTPLRFLVPSSGAATVFLHASGHEPLRLDLPERGGIRAQLSRLEEPSCAIALRSADGAALEGVGVELAAGERVTIPGAAVVRAKAGGEVEGARVVHCPSLGGQADQVLRFHRKRQVRAVRVTEPAGAAAYLDGEPIGRVPTVSRASASFVLLRVDDASGMSEERWVPAPRDIEVRMPTPKPRRIPILLVPAKDEAANEEAPPPPAPGPPPAGSRLEEARALLAEASAHAAQGRTKEARDRLKACLAIEPGLPDCHRSLGKLYRRLRNPQKAAVHFQRYLELAPEAADAGQIRRLLAGGR